MSFRLHVICEGGGGGGGAIGIYKSCKADLCSGPKGFRVWFETKTFM